MSRCKGCRSWLEEEEECDDCHQCFDCCSCEELFDADELGLDPETDDERQYHA